MISPPDHATVVDMTSRHLEDQCEHLMGSARALEIVLDDDRDGDALVLARHLEQLAACLTRDIVEQLRRRDVSWQEIGDLSGLSRQGAHKRWASS